MATNPTDRYYCVRCPTTKQPITREFKTLGQAIHVRDALKAKFPDKDFHVLASIPEDIVEAVVREHVEDSESH